MKNLVYFILIVFIFVSCNGFESEYIEEFNSSQLGEEESHDRGPDTVTPPDEVQEPEPFKCVKSLHHDPQFEKNKDFDLKACQKATSSQIATVNRGNTKKEKFLEKCYAQTKNSCWCDQLTRPNPNSINTFRCTYGNSQPHQLIHPNESTWKHAIEAAKIVLDLEKKGIAVKIIYNWWRPEPYNKNVGGAAGRHPYGTSVDVRFATKSDQNRAHSELCKMRKQGRLRAIGYYSSSAIHFGVGDSSGNTWGKSCP